jgi:MraZ protein
MFRGSCPTRVDEKGRLKVPADYKRLVDDSGKEFYITSTDGKRAQIYPLKEWEKKEEQLLLVPSSNPAAKKYLDATSYWGQVVEADSQGRLLLPQTLREAAKLTAEVVVLGKMKILEVVNHDEFKGALDANPLTDADLDALAALGI